MRRSSSKLRTSRGNTIAELLTVIFILGLFMSVVPGVLRGVTGWSSAAHAKMDNVQTAAQVFYRIQRDLRESTAQGVYTCSNSVTPTCVRSGNPVLAVATANDASGVFHETLDGAPSWQGFVVYWVASGSLYRSYQPVAGLSQPPSADAAATAVAAANVPAASTDARIATGVSSLASAVNATPPYSVALTLVTSATKGAATNSTSFRGDTVPRNSY